MNNIKNRQININLIVLGIVFAITFVSLFTYFPIYSNALEQKSQEMEDSAELQAILLKQIFTPVIKANSLYAKERETKTALEEIKSLWFKLNSNKPHQEFFLVHKNQTSGRLELLLSSKGDSPRPRHERLIKPSMYMAINGQYGVQSITDISDNIVLAAYAPIIDDEWGIVIMYDQSKMTPLFIENIAYTVFSALLISLIIWLVLRITLRNLSSRITQSEERYQQLLETSPDWLWETDEKGNITYSSHQTYALLGYKSDEILSHPINSLFANKDAKTSSLIWQQKLMLAEEFNNIEIEFLHKAGQLIYIQLSGRPMFNKRKKMIGYRGIARDITPLKQRENKINNMAYFDSLTHLANRRFMIDKLSKRISNQASSTLKPSSIIFIDLDNFKKINETRGHETGDHLIKIIAKRLQDYIPETDLLTRFSGDEFVILTKQTTDIIPSEFHNKMVNYLINLLAKINTPIHFDDKSIQVEASIGIAIIPKDGNTVSEILKNADNALLQAKSSGKNHYHFFDQSNQTKELERLKNSKQLKQAIAEQEFEVYYQLQYNTITNKIIGMEALLRWHHPESHKILSANEFLKNAYDTNHIVEIDEWVIKRVGKDIAKLTQTGINIPPISINLSSQKLEESSLPKMLEDTIKRNFISSSSIKVEITEGSLLHDLDKSMRTLQHLRQLGIKVCIDNFGIGYSSLSYIQSLPIESIKIDKSFIENIATSNSDMQICRTFIQLAKSLHLSIIAEGIQSEIQSEILKKEGCYIHQGYLYSRPESLDNIIDELSQNPLHT
ncbi:EAL and GGDEF domain-containing protein [Thiomicrorhabdus sp.]|uniref:sensor domain-containing protein n=1 Tax=Thiomicrorhabdus sp. TaxID=2039724 RepID=UPI002AA61C12|nr:EAL domain-containing protein [Thiomicrorhabdus sp.]